MSSIIGSLMFIIARAQKSHPYLNVVSLGFVAIALGALMMTLRGYVSDFASIIVGNTFIALWVLLIWHGVRVMYRRSSPWLWSLAGLVVFNALMAYYTYGVFDTQARIIISSVYLSLYATLAARELLLDKHKGIEHNFTASVLAVYSLLIMVRAIMTVGASIPADYMIIGPFHKYSVLLGIAVDVGLAIGFLWILQRKLERRLHDWAVALEDAHRITDQLRCKAEEAALHDPLTGAGNRRKYKMAASMEHERHVRYGRALSFAFLDVDHFKAINDQHGHDVGDKVLAKLVVCMSDIMRNMDMIYRWGGEEFVVLLPETDLPMAEAACQRIREAVQKNVCIDGKPVTVSIGVAQMQNGETLAALSKRADGYMYQAKQNGRNCISTG
ncbi:MAG: GGDEF domain-containing protein [Magnetovibrio sp.]|nr:GGDEF domain-containing protein [Magnetovibrio sp.]